MSLKVLDEASQRILQDAVRLINQRPPYSPTRSPFNPDTPSLDTNSTPEVYVCKVPDGGLPALSLAEVIDSVGTLTSTSGVDTEVLYQVQGVYCQVYQVDNIDGVLRQVPGNTPYVYNLSSNIIEEGTWILVAKDNYGDWYAVGTVSDNDIGTGTGTHEHIGGTPCDSLALLDQYDCLLISTTDPCGNPFETYLEYNDGHWTSEDVFCYIGGSGTFDFYYEAGRFHLLLDSKELIDCGTGCFTGAWITGHWTLVPLTGTGELNVSCDGPSFTICLECSCCPIDNWQGPGYYCIIDTSFTGTGTDFSNCEPVILEDTDKCDTSIVICSGRYETIDEVFAACGVLPTGTGTGITLVPSTCFGVSSVPDAYSVNITGVTNTGFCSDCTALNTTHAITPYFDATCKWLGFTIVAACTSPSAVLWQLDVIAGPLVRLRLSGGGGTNWFWTTPLGTWDFITPLVLTLVAPNVLCDNLPTTVTITPV